MGRVEEDAYLCSLHSRGEIADLRTPSCGKRNKDRQLLALLGPSEDAEKRSAPQGIADVHGAVGLRPSVTHTGHGRPCELHAPSRGWVLGAIQTIMQDATHCDFRFKERK